MSDISDIQEEKTIIQADRGEAASRWFVVPKPVSNPRVRLMCLPYAGGAATIFHNWWRSLPEDVEVMSVQLPRRGTRFREPPYRRMDALVADLRAALLPFLDRPYMIFGHSMGAIAAFELLRSLPLHLQPLSFFTSGRGAPHLPPVQRQMHHLNDEELIEELRQMNGTPEQVLNDPALMAMVLPALRADFEALETWKYLPGRKLSGPITAFGGDSDILVPLDRLSAWAEHTDAAFETRVVPGGHFFLHSCPDRILDVIADQLSRHPPRGAAVMQAGQW